MTTLSDDNQADIIEAFNSTSRYLDDLLNMDNSYFEEMVNSTPFEGMVNQIYPPEVQLNKPQCFRSRSPHFGLTSISNGFVS